MSRWVTITVNDKFFYAQNLSGMPRFGSRPITWDIQLKSLDDFDELAKKVETAVLSSGSPYIEGYAIKRKATIEYFMKDSDIGIDHPTVVKISELYASLTAATT